MEPTDPIPMPQPAIHTEGLSKRYGDTLALDALDLTVQRGRGVRLPRTQRRRQDDHDPAAAGAAPAERRPRRAVRDRRLARPGRAPTGTLAYVAGEPFLWPALTSAETFEFLARLHGGTDVAYRDELVERFQLDAHKKIRALSKGNRQKVQLIAALATRADLLLLDEPTSGLDPLMEMAFRECVHEAKERGQTVFLSSHILSEVEALCDRVGILREGRLVDEGTLAELRHLGAQTVEVTFTGAGAAAPAAAGRERRSARARTRCASRSPAARPADRRARRGTGGGSIKTLTSREPSLEEIFLHHYDGSDGRVDG